MKKLLLVDVPDDADKDFVPYMVKIVNKNNGRAFFTYSDIQMTNFTELTFTPAERDYLLTLLNHNRNGELYAPAMAELIEKVRQL